MTPTATSHRTTPVLDLEVERLGETYVLTLRGELDVGSAPELHALVAPLAKPGRTLLVDLERLSFLDVVGARCLVAETGRCREAGAGLVYVGEPPPVRRTLELTGLASQVPLASDARPRDCRDAHEGGAR